MQLCHGASGDIAAATSDLASIGTACSSLWYMREDPGVGSQAYLNRDAACCCAHMRPVSHNVLMMVVYRMASGVQRVLLLFSKTCGTAGGRDSCCTHAEP